MNEELKKDIISAINWGGWGEENFKRLKPLLSEIIIDFLKWEVETDKKKYSPESKTDLYLNTKRGHQTKLPIDNG